MKILAGKYRGRSLLPPKGRGTTRPITGMAKKSLFGMLGESLAGASVVDLFCGTGTLGLEAMSRGAETCCFADRDRLALERLTRNIETLDVDDSCTIWRGDIVAKLGYWLKNLTGQIDLAFVDPPYSSSRQWSWEKMEKKIFAPIANRLAENGTVVVRTDNLAKMPESLGGLSTRRVKMYGDMVLTLMGRDEEGE